ncbi:MAG: hypothetical protein PQJ59_03540 [Spirochaetales bacterium]|nr:hypothetical protein [Spirochaetales bacterium]
MDQLEAFYISEKHGIYGFSLNGAILAGMPKPGTDRELWDVMARKDLNSILCLTDNEAPYTPEKGVSLLAEKQLLDHFDVSDEALEKEARIIEELAAKGADALAKGESVVAHCRGGTGRTGTVIGGILRLLGYTWEETEAALISGNVLRGKYPGGWPESEWQRNLVKNWNAE